MDDVTSRRTRIAAALAAAMLLAGCSGSHHEKNPQPTKPTHRIAFQVEGSGTADVDYSTGPGAPDGRAARAALPWQKTVRSTGTAYTLSIVLGADGTDATCSISVDGRRVAGSSAHGAYGRATCSTGTARADD